MKKKKSTRRKKVILHGICQCKRCIKMRKGNRGTVIFMDPPYYKVKNLYGTKQWKEIDFVKLRNEFHELCAFGYSVILTLNDDPFIRELFRGYNIKEMKTYSGCNRKKIGELIITNLYNEELKKLTNKPLEKIPIKKCKK